MDVDLSTDLNALLPLVAPLLSGHSDLAIGSRLTRGSSVVRGPKRELVSRGYNVLLRSTLRARFTDAQCGFKAIRRPVAQALLPLVEDDTWFFDTELLVLAERSGLRIHEVPVDWVDDPDSNSEFPTVEVWETYMMRFARRVPEFGVPSQPVGLSALYDTTDDWVPIYDRSSLHGYFMACGTSGNQFKNAPIAGQFMRDIIDATMSGHDHDADPLQFRGAFTGKLIDLAAFSRKRPPAHTSNTVMG